MGKAGMQIAQCSLMHGRPGRAGEGIGRQERAVKAERRKEVKPDGGC